MENIFVKRLFVLKDALIINHLAEINDPRDIESYELLVEKTFDGEFDDIFVSSNLDGLSTDERKQVFDLSREYAKTLCIYSDLINSCEGVTNDDYDLVTARVLDNYDYVIRLARNGGKEVLDFLKKFEGSEFASKGAIIALLRKGFSDDDTLETLLIELSKEDGKYKDFTITQKIMLCEYPEGTLYKRDDNGNVSFIPSSELKSSFLRLVGENETYPMKNIDSKLFSEALGSIILDYYGAEYVKQ